MWVDSQQHTVRIYIMCCNCTNIVGLMNNIKIEGTCSWYRGLRCWYDISNMKVSSYSIYIATAQRLSPTAPLDTPARFWCEGRCCAGGGPHSCPWGAGETPVPTSSGWWVWSGGREKGHVYYTAVAVGCAASAADTGARQKLG